MSINKTHLWLLLAFALLLRLISLAAYPLMDTTEARYGEMARLMVETGNWLTPQFDYGVPFWGKPPLFTWMSAYGIELLRRLFLLLSWRIVQALMLSSQRWYWRRVASFQLRRVR
jgi:4-amino-4-deoxy-L-arabinose transferase-like glycosyltransferase